MTRGKLLGAAVAAIGLLLLAVPSYAHHSFAAEFDATKCADFTGTLTAIEWQNPHGYFHVDVKNSSGAVEAWTFQTVSIITLKRSGTSRRDFLDNVGKNVFVRGCLAKNGVKYRAAAETLKLTDGQVRIVGQEVERGGRQEY
jgi:Family of unknown function (DUF6152)